MSKQAPSQFGERSFGGVIPLALAGMFTFLALAAEPPAPPPRTLHFCVVGDTRGDGKKSQINGPVVHQLVAALRREAPDFVVVTGDLVSGYRRDLEQQLTAWRALFMAPLLDAGIAVYACRGNHDCSFGLARTHHGKTVGEVWNRVFSGRFAFPANGPPEEKNVTYFVRQGPVLLLVMDHYTKHRTRTHRLNTSWMAAVLKQHPGKGPRHVFVAGHDPAFSVGHRDCLASHRRTRDEFLRRFLNAGGVAYLCGHDHFYDHAKVVRPEGEFHQFICGTGGAPLRDWNGKYREKGVIALKHARCFGYLSVRVQGPRARLVMKGWDERGRLKTIDEFAYELKP